MNRTTIYQNSPWLAHQSWLDVLFLHWPVAVDSITPLLPEKIEPHLLDGKAWVSLVLFTVKHTHLRGFRLLPFLPAYYELNLRTYVTHKKRPGVVFLDISASHLIPVVLLSAAGLPYHKAVLDRKANSIQHANFFDKKKNTALSASYQVLPDACNETRDRWLTERYACFQRVGNHTYEYPVSHKQWPLQKVSLQSIQIDYSFQHLHLDSQPVCAHYSSGVDAYFHMRRRL